MAQQGQWHSGGLASTWRGLKGAKQQQEQADGWTRSRRIDQSIMDLVNPAVHLPSAPSKGAAQHSTAHAGSVEQNISAHLQDQAIAAVQSLQHLMDDSPAATHT